MKWRVGEFWGELGTKVAKLSALLLGAMRMQDPDGEQWHDAESPYLQNGGVLPLSKEFYP